MWCFLYFHGEDPFLGSLIAKARVQGFQGDNLSDISTIAACAKHYAGYGFSEAGRDYNTADFNHYTLHNTILPPYKAAYDAGVKTFMKAFNTIDVRKTAMQGLWHRIQRISPYV